MNKLLEFAKLSLESHVGEYDGPAFGGERECLLKGHIFFLHEICDDARGATGDTSEAMHQDTTTPDSFLNKLDGCWKVPNQAGLRSVRYFDGPILELTLISWLHA